MSGAVTAAVATVASVGMGAYEMTKANSNASSARNMQNTVFNEQQYYAQQLQNLVANPSSVTSLPGYQFEFQQGQNALMAKGFSQGLGGSGQLGTGLIDYGQNEALKWYNNQVASLSGLSGLTAPTSVGQYGQNALNAQQQSYNEMGGQLASLMYLSGGGGGGGGMFGGMFGGGPSYQGVTDSAGGTSPFATPNPGGAMQPGGMGNPFAPWT